MKALILQPGEIAPPGLLGDWCAERGIAFDVVPPETGPSVAGYDFVACLGSRFNPAANPDEPPVSGSLDCVREAVDRDIPVLGLCFGGQVLSAVLGGSVAPTPCPEFGWIEIETDDPGAVPAGPWLAWHRDRFTVPPGATEIARNGSGPQAFRHGRHLGTQFHPESTIEIVTGWGTRDGADVSHLSDPPGRANATPAATNAYRLFDGFLSHAERSAHDVAA